MEEAEVFHVPSLSRGRGGGVFRAKEEVDGFGTLTRIP
jgi:hypothetical protein